MHTATLSRLVHDAQARSSRTVQTIAVLVAVAGVLTAAAIRSAIADRLLGEILLLLPIVGLLCCALGLAQHLDLRLNLTWCALTEMPAFRQALRQADTRLQRFRRDVRTLFMHSFILLDSFVWSRVSLPTPLSVRLEHIAALADLIDAWLRNRSLHGVVDALAVQLLSGIDARPLLRLIAQLRASVTPQRARTSTGVALPLPRGTTLTHRAPAAAPTPNLRC